MEETSVKKIIWQTLCGVNYCHQHHVCPGNHVAENNGSFHIKHGPSSLPGIKILLNLAQDSKKYFS